MGNISAESLRRVGMILFAAAGVPEETSARVVDSLVLSNLKGHDSHGIAAAVGYLKKVRQGDIDSSALPAIVSESPTSALVDGRLGFGKIAADFAMDVLISKTKEMKVATVGIRNCHHIGRLGQYAERGVDSGIIAMITLCGGGAGTSTAPYGGAARTLGTNPFAFGCPAGAQAPLIVDFATTTVAGGKIAVARDRGESIPEGWILTKEGLPSTDPNDFYSGGMLQTMAGHKGFGLSMVAEALGGALTGATRFEKGDNPGNCVFMVGIATDVFQAAGEYAALEDRSISKVKSTPAAPGFEEVLIPGEPERRAQRVRESAGVPIPEKTQQDIQAFAHALGVGGDVEAQFRSARG
jgi:LDH2 family malate/lactate/ureidoglycolate dehydrogenase